MSKKAMDLHGLRATGLRLFKEFRSIAYLVGAGMVTTAAEFAPRESNPLTYALLGTGTMVLMLAGLFVFPLMAVVLFGEERSQQTMTSPLTQPLSRNRIFDE